MKERLLFVALLCSLAPATQALADAPPARYTLSAGTVYDTRTQLTWQQAVNASTYTQSAAITYCSNLSLAGTGWRLPTRAELLTLVDPTRSSPAVDPTAFPATPGAEFWTSSPYVASSGYAWIIYFLYGRSYFAVTSTTCRVRCVR